MTNRQARTGMASEKGMALIMVLLLLAVVSSLATGLTMNGRVEVAMAHNETYYAGARAAAEAGMNRAIAAIINNKVDNLLVTYWDTGDASFLLTEEPPYFIGPNGEYSYVIELFDDDDPAFHGGPLTEAQLTAMGEDDNPFNDNNSRFIVRVTGNGPNGTMVRVGRIIESIGDTETTTTPTTTFINPALLVNGDLRMIGNSSIIGSSGNVHANGNIDVDGSAYWVSGDMTATGTFTADNADTRIQGVHGGGRQTINVPDVHAENYRSMATHILQADGTINVISGPACVDNCGWTHSNGAWRITNATDNNASAGIFFAEGPVVISGNPDAGGTGQDRQPLPMTVIATGSIEVTGTPVLTPHPNALALQFVTDGDLRIAGNLDLDNPDAESVRVEGQSLVREQLSIRGNPKLLGQIIVQNVTDCAPCSDVATENSIGGHMSLEYNGTLDGIESEVEGGGPPVVTYTNNVAGWLEGM